MADAYHQLFRTYKEQQCNLPVCGIPVTFQSAKKLSGRMTKSRTEFGFTVARYKNRAAYCAVATEVEVNRESGRPRLVRAVAAVDSGQVVNPDGLINQIEGAILQSMSWTLYESVTFDDTRITSIDWQTYPILRFNSGPRQRRGACHQPARPAFSWKRRNRTGPGRGIDRKCHCRRYRQAAPPIAPDAKADQGYD